MKFRILYVFVPLVLAFTALVLMLRFLNSFSLSGQTANFSLPILDKHVEENSGNGITVVARRAISIPFGIDDFLPTSAEGQVIHVNGHGECPDGAETFRLKVNVRQDSVSAPALGGTEGNCPGGSTITWTADAIAPGPMAFEPGSASACGQAVIHFEKEGALTFKWCKPVTLE